MPDSTMLFISADAALIQAVQGVMNTLKNIRMEVVSEFEEAGPGWIGRVSGWCSRI